MKEKGSDNSLSLLSRTESSGIDWHLLAVSRLNRLVELEHDFVIMRDRLDQPQTIYRSLLNESEDRMQQIHRMEKIHAVLDQRLADQVGQYATMQASFLGSRSWRVTRPLRALSARTMRSKRLAGRIFRAMLRVPFVRRMAGAAARRMPGLHQRVRSKLYSQRPIH